MVSWAVTGATRGIGVSPPRLGDNCLPNANKITSAARLYPESCESLASNNGLSKDVSLTASQKSADPKNLVFALIRSRATAGPLEELSAERKNIHIVETEISNPEKLKETAAEISKVTHGSLDVLILNAGSAGPETSALSPSAL